MGTGLLTSWLQHSRSSPQKTTWLNGEGWAIQQAPASSVSQAVAGAWEGIPPIPKSHVRQAATKASA